MIAASAANRRARLIARQCQDALSLLLLPNDKGRQMRNLLATIFLAALAGNAAAEWTPVNWSKDATVYVDLTTLRRSGDTVKIWQMTDSNKPVVVGEEKFSSVSLLSELDCAEGRRRTLQSSFFQGQMLEGTHVRTIAKSGPWQYVQPGTLDDAVMKSACKKKGSN